MIGEKLSRSEFEVVTYLADRTWVDQDDLAKALSRTVGCLKVHVFRIREKLGDGAVIYARDWTSYMLGGPGVRYYRAMRAAEAVFAEKLNGR